MNDSKGKSYAARKPVAERPESDNYSTPLSLIWELDKLNILNKDKTVYEPAAGAGQMVKTLKKLGYNVEWDDLHRTKKDFLECTLQYPQICMNPPFSQFDAFVTVAKKVAPLVVSIAKVNFWGAYKRNEAGIWDGLRDVFVFNRQVDYRSSYNKDGLFNVGNLVTGIFVWDRSWRKKWWRTQMLNINQYAKLGQFKEE
jgi:hypothetical protein